MIFNKLQLWLDPVPRPGPEAMAVDQWLLETVDLPVLRVYRWAGDWASVGYFGPIADARREFPGINLVRRWTGGGIVDHRMDWTYTLAVPKNEALACERGAESYRRIHAALARVLAVENVAAHLSTGAGETGAVRCFENPVSHDLIGNDGRKLSGAGQRRNRSGLLQQGSVTPCCRDDDHSRSRATGFAAALAKNWQTCGFEPDATVIDRLVADRYGDADWTERR